MRRSATAAWNVRLDRRVPAYSAGGSVTCVAVRPIVDQSWTTASAVRYRPRLTASVGLMTSSLSGGFALPRCQPLSSRVQPAARRALLAALRPNGTAGSALGSNIGEVGGIGSVAATASPLYADSISAWRSMAARYAVRIAGVANSGWPGRRLSRTADSVELG